MNEQVGIARSTLRRFRATLYQIERDGPAGKRWGNSNNVLESIEGFANFISMVDRDKGVVFQRRVRAIIEKYGRPGRRHIERARWKPKQVEDTRITLERAEPEKTEPAIQVDSSTHHRAEKKPWWKFW